MKDAELDAAKERAYAAREGTWQWGEADADVVFIAHAREDVLRAVDDAQSARAMLREIEHELDQLPPSDAETARALDKIRELTRLGVGDTTL